jgi:hypothetical protein
MKKKRIRGTRYKKIMSAIIDMRKYKRGNMKRKQKLISMTEYNKIMSDIIDKGHPVSDTLIEMLNEASKYQLPESIKITKKKRKT